MKPLVALVLTYYDRAFQTLVTLESIGRSAYDNFVVVLVDDASPEPFDVHGVRFRFNLAVIRLDNKRWHSPDVAYNVGIGMALQLGAEVIVLQNAESFHMGDVVTLAAGVKDDEYVSCSCFSLGERETYNGRNVDDLLSMMKQCRRGATHDGDCAWYNHPVYRPVA